MPISRETTLRTLTALGVEAARGEGVLHAIRTGGVSIAPAPLPAEVGARIGDPPYDDRYELTQILGHGASGAVYAAHDHVMDEDVAIKLLRTLSDREIERMRREIGVLRMVRVPGVVGFRDEGAWNHLPFVVMELVRGEPFPGIASHRWEDVAEVVVGLVEALGRLHEIGIIHRDLKPANVLTVQGRATLLDFGLASPQSDADDVVDGQLAGTPAYLAPEVFFGVDPSPASDLYALGVMLYEALCGQRPHDGETLAQLVQAVLFEQPVPLIERADVPPVIGKLVMRLLSREPENRPESALEVLRVLRDGALMPKRRPRRLGPRDPLERALGALREGWPIDVGGPRGSGRTRLLEDVEQVLVEEGARVARTAPAVAPFGSLEPVLGTLDGELPDLATATAVAESRVRELLRDGLVLLVDDPHRMDPSTAALVGRVREAGAVLRVVDGPADVELGPLSVEELMELFAGPRRILHLPDDAAAIVHARVGGLPGAVVERLGAWVRAGLASWQGDRAFVDRAALDRLGAGLEVDPMDLRGDDREVPDELAEVWRAVVLLEPHATLARIVAVLEASGWSVEARLDTLVEMGILERRRDRYVPSVQPPRHRWSQGSWASASRAAAAALPDHALQRVLRLLQAGELHEVPRAAHRIAAHQLDEDRPGFAWAIVCEGLAAARRVASDEEVPALLSLALRIGLVTSDRRLLTAVRVEIARCDPDDDRRLGALCQVATRVLSSGGRGAWDELRALGPYADPELELWRLRVTSFAAGFVPLEVHAAWVESAGAQAEGLPGGRTNRYAWEAAIRFRRRDFEGAAALEEQTWRQLRYPVRSLASGLNTARTWAEAGRFDDTDRILAELRNEIMTRRMPTFEAYWCQLHRQTRYRRGELVEPDLDLLEAVRSLGSPGQAATHLLLEAACAWRRGEPDRARPLAVESAECYERIGLGWAGALARALACACGDPQDADLLIAQARSAPYPDVALQIYGLLRRPVPRSVVADLDVGYPADARREILSRAEALELSTPQE